MDKQSQIRRTVKAIMNPLNKNMYQLFGRNYTQNDTLFKEHYEEKHELENTLNKLTIQELIDLRACIRLSYRLVKRDVMQTTRHNDIKNLVNKY